MENPTCLAPDCGEHAQVRGLCRRHYGRWYDAPQLHNYEPLPKRPPSNRVCDIEDCGKPHASKGLCATHYAHQRTYGTPHRRKYPCPNCGLAEPRGGYRHDLGKYCSERCHKEHRLELRAKRVERDRALAEKFLDGPPRKCGGCKGMKPALDFVGYWGKPTKRCAACRAKATTYSTPEQRRDDSLRRTYGIGASDYERMFADQSGNCAICLQPESTIRNGVTARLHVDHDHETGSIRGLLCSRCNVGIGQFKEDPERLQAAVDYLSRTKMT